jgi:hypothetical protein
MFQTGGGQQPDSIELVSMIASPKLHEVHGLEQQNRKKFRCLGQQASYRMN